ncbi:MAG: lysylphosphatidylglycerol synthase transmembrane domain-containing protein [Pseudolysinimonas sp.]
MLAIAALALLLYYVVIPQFVEAGHDVHESRGLSPWPLLLALALELASLAAYGALTWTVLDPRDRPNLGIVTRVDLAGVGTTNAIPAGGAFALAVRYRLLASTGSSPSTIVGGIAVEVILSNLLLGAVFALGLLLSLASLPPSPYYQYAGVFMVVIFGGAAIALAIAVRRRERVAQVVGSAARRLPEAWRDRAVRFADDAVGNVAALSLDRRRFAAAVFWGAINWLLDAAALGVLLAAFGYTADPGQLLLVYGLVGILALIPITPGGLGIVEGVMVPLLVALGSTSQIAILGVIAWRLLQFWMPMPLGALSALSLLAWPNRPRRSTR